MVMKYAFNVQLFLFTPDGFAHFYELAPEGLESDFQANGFDLFKAILIAHGWFYVVYLFACFRLWSLMRWGFGRFLMLAGGGVVPFLSFVMEGIVARDVKRYLAEREAAAAAKRAATTEGALASATSEEAGREP